MTTALTNTEVMRMLDSWLVKYSPDQLRDERGRWASVQHDPSDVHDPERLQHAATHTARQALVSAAALSNALASVEGVSSSYSSGSYLAATHHAIDLAGHLQALHHHTRETFTHGRKLAHSLRPVVRQIADHVRNAGDHLRWIEAEGRGDHERADLIMRRINLRRRAMAVRRAGRF
jgi:hypothetical protein